MLAIIDFVRAYWTPIAMVFVLSVMLVTVYCYYSRIVFSANRETFQDTGKGPVAELMLFFSKHCPHCVKFKPDWETIKSQYANKTINGKKITFTDRDCTDENSSEVQEWISTYGLQGYPTILLVSEGKIHKYEGPSEKERLVQYLESVL